MNPWIGSRMILSVSAMEMVGVARSDPGPLVQDYHEHNDGEMFLQAADVRVPPPCDPL